MRKAESQTHVRLNLSESAHNTIPIIYPLKCEKHYFKITIEVLWKFSHRLKQHIYSSITIFKNYCFLRVKHHYKKLLSEKSYRLVLRLILSSNMEDGMQWGWLTAGGDGNKTYKMLMVL